MAEPNRKVWTVPKRVPEVRPKQVNVRMTEAMYDRLTLVAAAEGSDRAEVVRVAVDEAIGRRLADPAWKNERLGPLRRGLDELDGR